MNDEEIKATLLGQTVSKYDGWNGSNEQFVVTSCKCSGNAVSLYGERGGRNYDPCIYFHRDIVETLILAGKYVSYHEIDHCHYDVAITLLPDEGHKLENRINRIKHDIKCLKQELKQAQQDYNNYLISSIRIDVMRNNNEQNK